MKLKSIIAHFLRHTINLFVLFTESLQKNSGGDMSDKPINMELLVEQLKLHEGYRKEPYYDTEGILTWGIGRNLEANPLTDDEILHMLYHGRESAAEYCLTKDVQSAIQDCKTLYSFYDKLSEVRKRVLIDMAFNLGRNRLRQFVKMASALESRNYTKAAEEMLNSRWAYQVGRRATRLSEMMKTNENYKN